jgi:hypothetical protein
MIIKNITLLSIVLFIYNIGYTQDIIYAEMTKDNWEIDAVEYRFSEYLGEKALYLQNGKARWVDTQFKNGIIEYDIAFEKARNFAGVHFHIVGDNNYEEYYLRPHQSGNSDAMQYTPVINGNASWQLYTGKGYWGTKTYNFNTWMHVKLIINGEQMQVFIDDMDTPVLHVSELKLGSINGGVGFGTFLGSAYYANLSILKSDQIEFIGTKKEENSTLDKDIIRSYKVSEAFSSDLLRGVTDLENINVATNETMEAESSGILNLSRVSEVSPNTNTILVKASIITDRPNLMKRIDFGYSDQVKVFVNNQLVYSGNNSFRSRDYRYLGSIGIFDSIYFELQEGENEIAFAITERMGGWGIISKFVDED